MTNKKLIYEDIERKTQAQSSWKVKQNEGKQIDMGTTRTK